MNDQQLIKDLRCDIFGSEDLYLRYLIEEDHRKRTTFTWLQVSTGPLTCTILQGDEKWVFEEAARIRASLNESSSTDH